MQFCLQQRIPIYLLSGKGKYYGMVDSFDTDSVLLHQAQFRCAENEVFCLQLAKQFIAGKVANSKLVLKRKARHKTAPALDAAASQLGNIQNQLNKARDLDQLRGYEGNAARIYFQAIAKTVAPQWGFNKRNKHPPTDPINAMLSYGYTLLFYNTYSFLRTRGLNPHVGHLHPMRRGHPALASDMMEEFRAIIVDTVVLNLVLNERISVEDFIQPEHDGEACLMTKQARGIFVHALEKKFNTPLRHPHSGYQLDYRRCLEHQTQQLARSIRDASPYQAMILR